MPILFLCFAAFVAALWLYVSTGPSSDSPRQRDILSDPEFAARVERVEHDRRRFARDDAVESEAPPTPDRPVAPRARSKDDLKEQWARRRRSLERLAERLDDTAVRLRTDVRRSTTFQLVAGWSDLHGGHADAAVRHFDHILDRDPDHPEALYGKATALTTRNRYDKAVDAYERLIRLRPGDVEYRFNYGALLSRIGEFGAATEQFREVIRLEPVHAKAHYNLAGLAQREGRLTEARDSWQAFTRLKPEVSEGWFNLGIVYLDLAQPREAVRCFSLVTIMLPDDPLAYANLALAHTQTNDLEAALDALKTADELSPCDPAILHNLAELHRTIAAWHPTDEEEHLEAAASIETQLKRLETESATPTALIAENDDAAPGE